MGSSLFLSDLLTGHERENRKTLEINDTVFRFMERWGDLLLPFMASFDDPKPCIVAMNQSSVLPLLGAGDHIHRTASVD
jgi:hypothetical protein